MDDVTNIWTSDDELNEDQLLNYLKGNATGEDANAVEKQMEDSDFVKDAMEGLQAFNSPKKLDDFVHQLNKKLQVQLEAKKEKNAKREIKHLGWIIFSVILILVLCVLGYVVIHMAEHK